MDKSQSEHAQRYTYLNGQIQTLEGKNNAMARQIKENNDHISFLMDWRNRIKDGICEACRGQGKVRVQHAQDDIRIETCDECKGTGEKPTQEAPTA